MPLDVNFLNERLLCVYNNKCPNESVQINEVIIESIQGKKKVWVILNMFFDFTVVTQFFFSLFFLNTQFFFFLITLFERRSSYILGSPHCTQYRIKDIIRRKCLLKVLKMFTLL